MASISEDNGEETPLQVCFLVYYSFVAPILLASRDSASL